MPGLQFFDSQECEWVDMTVNFAGSPLTKIRGLKYKAAQEKEALYAAGDEPISIQSGHRTYDGTIKVLKGALDDMNKAALAAGARDILDMEFDIVVVYAPKGIRLLHTDVLTRCQVKEFEKGWDTGAKMMEISLPIMFLGISSI
ncbi:MAG: hypothetical protein P4L41_16385 [Flavipsychrobacter sp.]|nr:hypothetical protein [Flavipsychrobacter sp.]